MEQRLTPWFVNGEKPARDGVYQQRSGGREKEIGYQRYQDGLWYVWEKTPERAAISSWVAGSFAQQDPWRGLAYEPIAAMASQS